jgi:hypothetical protein
MYQQPGYLSGTALVYGLDYRGFESRQGLGIFLFITASSSSGAHPASYPMGSRGSYFPEDKEAGA